MLSNPEAIIMDSSHSPRLQAWPWLSERTYYVIYSCLTLSSSQSLADTSGAVGLGSRG